MTPDAVRDLLIEIKTRLDIALMQQADHETRIRTVEQRKPDPDAETAAKLADHETRIRAVERARWLLVGGAVAAGGVAGKLAGFL